MRTLPKTDVVIIGLGAAGGMASYVLTKAGLNVVGIEAGPRLSSKDFVKQLDELGGNSHRNRLGEPKVNKEVPTWRPNTETPAGPPPIVMSMMNGVGGTSIHWGTQSWRYRADDFKIRSETIKRYGESALPPDSALADWPLSYDELEPYYDQVEHVFGVSGQGGSNPFAAKRSRDYPMPPLRKMGYSEMGETAMKNLGYHPFPQPSGIASQPYQGRPACTYCGFCSGFGCWNNSKSSTLITAIPEAEATGKLEVRPNCRVTQIMTDKDGRAIGVEYLDESKEVVQQPAAFVILSTFVYENTRMLLLSKSDAYPAGLSNNHGQVGKYYMSHSYVSVNGLFPGKELNLFSGTYGQATAMDDLNGDNFDHTGLGFLRGAVVFAGNGNLPIAAVSGTPPDVPRWGQEYKDWIRKNSNSVGGVFSQVETLPYNSNFLDLDPDKKDPDGVPVVRVTYDFHDNERKAGAYFTEKLTELIKEMGATKTWYGFPPIPLPLNTHAYGGTRMGEDPTTSVVDGHCISHEVPNLAVLGGSCWPNITGYNPTQTILAVSWRAAEYIAKNFESLAV